MSHTAALSGGETSFRPLITRIIKPQHRVSDAPGPQVSLKTPGTDILSQRISKFLLR